LLQVRKKELVTTLRDDVAPGLMVFCREVLEKQAAGVLQAPDTTPAHRAHLAILRAVLDVFVAYFDWLNIRCAHTPPPQHVAWPLVLVWPAADMQGRRRSADLCWTTTWPCRCAS
jgi:hypothetical protein